MVQLADIVDTENSEAVFKTVKALFLKFYPEKPFEIVETAVDDFMALFTGKYPGYRPCNTRYHDIVHTTDAILAFSRLVDGYNLSNKPLTAEKVTIGLISAILHDCGYIQKEDDTTGTGAKYTLDHVERSIDFIGHYLKKKGLFEKYFLSARSIIACTGVRVDLSEISFSDSEDRVLGSILGTADLIGQVSARNYLEKLVYLYQEFCEGGVSGYESEFDLLGKSIDFYYNIALKRLENVFGSLYCLARIHFNKRHQIDRDLYLEAMEGNMAYLKAVIQSGPADYREKLRRYPFSRLTRT